MLRQTPILPASMFDVIQRETNQCTWTYPCLSPSSSPFHGPLYISCHYIQQSVQCAAGEPAGSVQRNSKRGRQRGGKCERISALTLETFIWRAPAIPAHIDLLLLPLFFYLSLGIREAHAAAWFQDTPDLNIRMGCTTGHLACQTQPQTSLGQESQSLEAGGAKVPEVLSSLERLSQATGGMEKSWYRCIFPFGIISLVIGVAGTGVTYTYNDLPQTKVVSVVLLVMGLLMLLMATACWTAHKKKRRKKKEGGSFTSEQCPL